MLFYGEIKSRVIYITTSFLTVFKVSDLFLFTRFSEACPGFFYRGQIPILLGYTYFHQGENRG